MNFNKPGWFDKYVEFRQTHPFPESLPHQKLQLFEEGRDDHGHDQAIYRFLLPTGLLYGFPTGLPFLNVEYPNSEYFDEQSKVHLIFLESLFGVLVSDRNILLAGYEDGQSHFSQAAEVATAFFLGSPTEARGGKLSKMVKNIVLGKFKKSSHDQIEEEIKNRIQHNTQFFLLKNQYYNSFLFLDLYFCLIWQRICLAEPERQNRELPLLAQRHMDQKMALLRLMIAAADADHDINPVEKRLIAQFVESSGLPPASIAALRADIDNDLQVEQVDIPELPWLVRRYFLELLLMTLIAGGTSAEESRTFMDIVTQKLDLWDDELNQSQTAMEVFLLNQQENLPFLREESKFKSIGDKLKERAALAVRKNLDRLVQEINETKELYELLMKSTKTSLTQDERNKVQAQLMDIIKTIPALAIFALPGGGVVLPVLIRLLPFNLLPSAFED